MRFFNSDENLANMSVIDVLHAISVLIGSLVMMGMLVCGIFSARSWVINASEPLRKRRAQRLFTKGVQYGYDLLEGRHDRDIMLRMRLQAHEVSEAKRLIYINSSLGEARYFGINNEFDEGVISVIRQSPGYFKNLDSPVELKSNIRN